MAGAVPPPRPPQPATGGPKGERIVYALALVLLVANCGIAITLLVRTRKSTSRLERQDLDVLRRDMLQTIEDLRKRTDENSDRLTRNTQDTLNAGRKAQAEDAERQQRTSLENLKTWLDPKLEAVTKEVKTLRDDTQEKLSDMRKTVDEKLQETLEKRITESFQTVNERLEAVFKGLGDMQTLAQGVGDLKRVLTNVKSRGTWGEVQLGRQIEDMLTAEQYCKNEKVKPGSSEQVEYAIKLPGNEDGQHVLLPIDSKFPQEDYDQLQLAQEAGDSARVEELAKALERAVRNQAKDISDKYIAPPHTTDFAIMYLPTEGLFAEVIRRPGLVSRLQQEFRVTIAGPTTLMMLLNSLHMGFRTLAIQKRSSEVWKVLGQVKTEFLKYAKSWEDVGSQLEKVQKSVADVGVRTRAVNRQLRSVEEDILPLPTASEEATASAFAKIEEGVSEND